MTQSEQSSQGATHPARGLTQGLQVLGLLLISGWVWVSVRVHTELLAEYMDPMLLQRINSAAPVQVTVGELGLYYGSVIVIVPVLLIIGSRPEVITDAWL